MSAGTKMYVPMRSQNSVEQGIPYFVFYHRFVPNLGDEELILKTKWIVQTNSVAVSRYGLICWIKFINDNQLEFWIKLAVSLVNFEHVHLYGFL